MYYYPMGNLFDYVFGIFLIVFIAIVFILLIKFDKKKEDPKRTDKEYLRTLELPELRFVEVGAKDVKIIEGIIEEKTSKL